MIQFSKMHGLGNDFMVINTITQKVDASHLPIQSLAHRNLGVGFDQLLLIEPSQKADFFCRIFNADGSEAEQCGNGLRCVARFIYDEKMSSNKTFSIETKAGIFAADILDHDTVRVQMGIPSLQQKAMTLKIDSHPSPLQLDILSLGNPHAILQVNSTEHFPVATLGPKIEKHSLFPRGVNVGFMEIVDKQHIRLRTFERGAGETFSCGSNACAAVVAGIENNTLDHKVKVELPFGDLWVEWQGAKQAVMLTGPASRVFEGVIRDFHFLETPKH